MSSFIFSATAEILLRGFTNDYVPKTVTLEDRSIPTADISIETYLWEFGDGDSSSEETPTHTYQTPGNYTLKVTLGLNNGNNATTEKSINFWC